MKWYEDPVYIKMCDCEEIQKGKITDGVSGQHIGKNIIICSHRDVGSYYYNIDTIGERENEEQYIESSKSIWLPRLDQLLEMIKETTCLLSDGEWVYRFGQWCFPQFPNIVKTSINQLLIAFVMKENHSKTWDGSKWIKEALCVSS